MSQFDFNNILENNIEFPELIMVSKEGSFAWYMMKNRIPEIIDDVIAQNNFSEQINQDLVSLKQELITGTVQPLTESAFDSNFWKEASKPYLGLNWLDLPSYWGESFFYRRLLEITQYFQYRSLWYKHDPFGKKKQKEWDVEVAPQLVSRCLKELSQEKHDLFSKFRLLLHASLWGNRVDLSHNVFIGQEDQINLEVNNDDLIIDDSIDFWNHITKDKSKYLTIVVDNSGTELSADLMLVDFLLSKQIVERIWIHFKSQPYYVSDALVYDFENALTAFELKDKETQMLSKRLRSHLQNKKLLLHDHWFYTSSLFYYELPNDLLSLYSSMDMIILKGDLNYRRLMGDAWWPHTTSFQEVTKYFPNSILCLRTLKSEVLVGLSIEQLNTLESNESNWRINGKRGVIQGNVKT